MLYTIEAFEEGFILTVLGAGMMYFATLREVAQFLAEE